MITITSLEGLNDHRLKREGLFKVLKVPFTCTIRLGYAQHMVNLAFP